jgi:ankyrin repeat protein
LQWLCYSTRPLQLLEIRDVLAIVIEGDGGFYPEDRLPDPFDIMVVCSSLISCNEDIGGNDHATDTGSSSNGAHDDSVDEDSISGNDHATDTGSISNEAHDGNVGAESMTQVRLAHFSVQEFLLSDRCRLRSDFQMQTCHRVIAEGCLHYLLYLSEKGPLTQEVVDHHPLARYAAEFWWQHAQKVESTPDGAILDLVLQLLTNGNATLLLWVQLYNIEKPWDEVDLSRTVSDVCPPLYYAALIGLPEVVERVLDAGADVNAVGGRYSGNALCAASKEGHEMVVQVLLDAGADINAVGGEDYGDALQAASREGHEKVVQMLLGAGADINATGGHYDNALQAASREGHERVVQILLHAGADIEAENRYRADTLQAASIAGHEQVVQILLDAGADVNAVGGPLGNALDCASHEGYEKVVQMLLHAGADFEVEDSYYGGNALHAASTGGHKKVVQILIDWNLAGFMECYERMSQEVR